MITLRPDQEQNVNALRASMRKHKRVFLCAPCGYGKTVCFSYIAMRASERGKHVNIMVHRKELVDQVSETLSRFDVRHGIIAAGYSPDPRQLVQVSSVFTLAKRMERVHTPDLWIADEAHHAVSGNIWGRVIAEWEKVAGIGVSATPWRLNGQGFDDLFGELILGPTVRELIDAGNLSPYRLWRPTTINREGMHHIAGELVTGEIDTVMESDIGKAIVGSAIEHYESIVQGAPSIAFTHNVKAAHNLAERFRARGWNAAAVDGKMDDRDRRQIITDCRAGKLNMLTSCALVGEGLDIGALRAGFLLNPTESLAKYIQEVMRPMRVAPGKDEALLFDHVGNSDPGVHGLPDQDREWSLKGRDKRARAPDAACPVRRCPQCYATLSAATLACPCGYVFKAADRLLQEVDGQLVEVDTEAERKTVERKRVEYEPERKMARSEAELVELGRRKGMKNPEGWARHVWAAREARQKGRATA